MAAPSRYPSHTDAEKSEKFNLMGTLILIGLSTISLILSGNKGEKCNRIGVLLHFTFDSHHYPWQLGSLFIRNLSQFQNVQVHDTPLALKRQPQPTIGRV